MQSYHIPALHSHFQCSPPCGQGTQVRPVSCVTTEGTHVADYKCKKEEKPVERRQCHSEECVKASWVYGDWEEVSGSGFYTSYRTPLCFNMINPFTNNRAVFNCTKMGYKCSPSSITVSCITFLHILIYKEVYLHFAERR